MLFPFLFCPTVIATRLPGKIGRINDYANVLRVGDHSELEDKLTELANLEMGLTILISLNDPYNNPDRYGFEVSRKWGLSNDPNEGLIVFVKEDDCWKASFSLSGQLTGSFSGEVSYGEFQNEIRSKVESGEVRDAVLESVNTLYALQFRSGSTEANNGESSEKGYLLYFVVGGALLLVIVVFLVIREARLHCPKCGSRMKVTGAGPGRREKYCPRCGYYERE